MKSINILELNINSSKNWRILFLEKKIKENDTMSDSKNKNEKVRLMLYLALYWIIVILLDFTTWSW